MRRTTSQQFPVAILQVLRELFDDLGLARRLETQHRQPPSDFMSPVNHICDC
jgi:hypothetical protein